MDRFTQHRCSYAYSYGLTAGSHPNQDRTNTDEISVARQKESKRRHKHIHFAIIPINPKYFY